MVPKSIKLVSYWILLNAFNNYNDIALFWKKIKNKDDFWLLVIKKQKLLLPSAYGRPNNIDKVDIWP